MTYIKDFDGWSISKKKLHDVHSDVQVFPKVRQIWFVKLGVNVGYESDGKGEFTRPALVVARIGSLLWCVPMTTKEKHNVFHHEVESISFKKVKKSFLMLSQARVLDKKRFLEHIQTMPKQEFLEVQKKLRGLYLPAL